MHTVWWLRIAPGSTQVLPSLWTSMSHSHSQQDLGQRCQQEMFHLRSSAATRVIVSLPGHLIFDRHRDHISFCSSSSLKREPTSSTLLLMLGQECSTTQIPYKPAQTECGFAKSLPVPNCMEGLGGSGPCGGFCGAIASHVSLDTIKLALQESNELRLCMIN